MYSYLTRFKIVLVVGLVFLFIGTNSALGIDLADEIYSTFKKQFDGGYNDAYLNTSYSSNFPKDPFQESFDDIEDMSRQSKIAGTEYIEKLLAEKGCSLPKKKIWAILYFYVPEFRSELAHTLKVGLGDYASKHFTFDEDEVMDYCEDYFSCIKGGLKGEADRKAQEEAEARCTNGYPQCFNGCMDGQVQQAGDKVEHWGKDVVRKDAKAHDKAKKACQKGCKSEQEKYDDCVKGNEKELKKKYREELSSDTPAHIKTNCKQFFVENYNIGKDSEEKKQDLQMSQLGFDKFRNATTDDSAYDIMVDFGTIGRLLFTDAEQPITPVSYMLPMFSNSAKALKKHKENGSSYDNNGNGGDGGKDGGGGQPGNGGSRGSSSDPIPLQLPRDVGGVSMEDGYEDLVEGLGAFSLKKTDSQFGSLCYESEEEPEQETQGYDRYDGTLELALDLSDYSDEEIQEVIDYMKSAVDSYASLPDDKKEEMKKRAGNITDLERTAKEIKNCWQGCEGLRVDQYASCLIMCTCGEIKSSDDPINLFDPEKFPGLGPVFVIRFCAVPATNTKFSKGGKKIVSIEEGFKEIYGVLDKLSREGRLGIWTQEYNFLDSSTKKMNMADTVAFSIDIEFVDIAGNYPKQSEQYLKKEIKNANKSWQKKFHISNDREDPVSKNYYGILASKERKSNDVSTKANAERTEQSQTNVAVESSSMVDLNSDSRASHYSNKVQLLNKWIDQQGHLWEEHLKYIEDYIKRAKALSAKPKLP